MQVSIPFSGLASRLGQPDQTVQCINQYFKRFGFAVANGANMMVAGGSDEKSQPNMCWSTNNGLSWYPANNNFFGGGNGACRGVAYSPTLSRWVAVGEGNNGTVAYSNDGKTWIASQNYFGVGGAGYGVAFANGRFVICGFNNSTSTSVEGVAWSTDGLTWTSSIMDGFFGSSAFYSSEQNKWVVVGGDNFTSSIYYSVDNATTFVPSDNYFFGNGVGRGVFYGNGRWVAVGANGDNTRSIGYSDDGIVWKSATNFWSTEFSSGLSVSFAKGVWVACGVASIPSNCYSLDNGVTWLPANLLMLGGSVVYNSANQYWIQVGFRPDGFCILASSNGIDWGYCYALVTPGLQARLLPLLPFFYRSDF